MEHRQKPITTDPKIRPIRVSNIRITMPTRALFFAFILALIWQGCVTEPNNLQDGMGKRPVYLPESELGDITNLSPQPVGQTGTIFLRDSLFFMLEQKKGIHVFNVKDSANVKALTFIKIPAVSDFTVSGNRLYADSWKDLLTIDISNLQQVSLLDRQKGVFQPLLFPPLYNGIFECVDESKGAVVDWEDAFLEDARCRTVN